MPVTPSERLKGIEAFVATADTGSFTAAGLQLNLTNSAVGKSVARIEARLGVRLFERTTRRLAMTDAGTAYYRTCVRVLEELEAAEVTLAAHRAEPMGRLRLDAPAAFGRMRVWPLLLDFVTRHPQLRPHVSFTDRFVDLVDEGIDVGVRIGGPDQWPPSLGHRYLGSERLVFGAAPAYLAERGTPASAGELAQHDLVLYGKSDGTTSPWLIAHQGGLPERRVMDGRIVVGSGEAQVSAVKAGCGIAQLATWLVRAELESGELVALLPALDVPGLPLHLVWPLNRQGLPKVDAVLDWLGESLQID